MAEISARNTISGVWCQLAVSQPVREMRHRQLGCEGTPLLEAMTIVYVCLLAMTKHLTSHFCTLGTTASVIADKERGGLIFVEI